MEKLDSRSCAKLSGPTKSSHAESRFGIVIERLVSLYLTETIPATVTSPMTFESSARVILLLHHRASMVRPESAVLRGDARWGRSRSPGHPTGCLRSLRSAAPTFSLRL